MATNSHKIIVGRAERVSFPDQDIANVPAKIDTGAFRTSIWASDIREEDGRLRFKMFGEGSQFYTGEDVEVDEYETVSIENSFAQSEERYSIKMRVKLGTKTVNTNITLADRSQKKYPVLVGRKLLRNKFLVDVAEGNPIEDDQEY